MNPSIVKNNGNITRLFKLIQENSNGGGGDSLIDILNTEYKTEYVYPYLYTSLSKLSTPDSDSNHRIIRVDFTIFDNPVILKALGSWDDRYILNYI
jgi:hypothetical protein